MILVEIPPKTDERVHFPAMNMIDTACHDFSNDSFNCEALIQIFLGVVLQNHHSLCLGFAEVIFVITGQFQDDFIHQNSLTSQWTSKRD